jgi:hypothetical protein
MKLEVAGKQKSPQRVAGFDGGLDEARASS